VIRRYGKRRTVHPDEGDGPSVLFFCGSDTGDDGPHVYVNPSGIGVGQFFYANTPGLVEELREAMEWMLESMPSPPPKPTHLALTLGDLTWYRELAEGRRQWFFHGKSLHDPIFGATTECAMLDALADETDYPTEEVTL